MLNYLPIYVNQNKYVRKENIITVSIYVLYVYFISFMFILFPVHALYTEFLSVSRFAKDP